MHKVSLRSSKTCSCSDISEGQELAFGGYALVMLDESLLLTDLAPKIGKVALLAGRHAGSAHSFSAAERSVFNQEQREK